MGITEQRPALLTTSQAARLLGLDRRTVARLVAAGKLPGIRFGAQGNWRLPRREVERLIEGEGR